MILNKCIEGGRNLKKDFPLVGKKTIGLNIILIILLGLILLSITIYTSYAIFSADISGNNTISISFKKPIRPKLLSLAILGDSNSNIVTTGDGLYSTTETNSGNPSYYYKGNVTNNYVKLDEDKDGAADTLYRIIRINEDGSIRMIRQYGLDNNKRYNFNPNYWTYNHMYYSESNVEGGIMKRLEDWYSNTFGGSELDTKNKIVEGMFCEQAKVKRVSSITSGNATMEVASNSYMPTYKCVTDGNKKGILNKKVGLISADEAVFAGIPLYTGSQANNTNTYLHTGQDFWTISPAGFLDPAAYAWYVNYNGCININEVSITDVVRPVLSLSADTTALGDGTSTEPYTIVMDN